MSRGSRLIIVVVAGVVLLAAAGFAVADYRGWFGRATYTVPDIVSVRYAVVDDASGEPVTGAQARCLHGGSQDLCTPRPEPGRPDHELRLTFAIPHLYASSLMFTHDLGLYGVADVDFAVAFLHPDYELKSHLSDYDQILAAESGPPIEVRLKPAMDRP